MIVQFNNKGEAKTNVNTTEHWNDVYSNRGLWGNCKEGIDSLINKGIIKGNKILEIGIGLKETALEFYKLGYDVTAIDISEVAMETQRNNCKGIDFRVMDARKLYFDDETFDFIYSNDVLEHFHETKEAIKEWLRVLKPDRYISIGTVDIGYPNHTEHCRKFSKETLREDLGLQEEEITIYRFGRELDFSIYKPKGDK